MIDKNLGHFFDKKAYEISYSAFKIGAVLRIENFRERLYALALALLETTAKGYYADSWTTATSLEYLLRLGADTGIVHPDNAKMVIEEIAKFNSAIIEFEKSAKKPPFAEFRLNSELTAKGRVSIPKIGKEDLLQDSPLHERSETQKADRAKSAVRQSAILNTIRQLGNCRIKTIQDSLPGVSERTIRYDLQDLIQKGLVERIGSGGPSTFYRVSTSGSESAGDGVASVVTL